MRSLATADPVLKTDLCVIGAGSGGLSVAVAAASFKVPVVLIERGLMGGDCLNYGCVPSKALLAAAKHAHLIRDGAAFGIPADTRSPDFGAVMAHVKGVIASIAPHDSAERMRSLGVEVVHGSARFEDRETVGVDGRLRVRARRFVIATGSSPIIPDIPGLAGTPFLTNETLFNLTSRPDHLLILGAGPVGLEMAQAFRRLGSEVTVVDAGEILPREEPEAAALLRGKIEGEGVRILSGVRVGAVDYAEHTFCLTVWEGESSFVLSGSHLLVATGRAANVAGLQLDNAGIQVSDRKILLDEGLRTTNRRVYAIGDAAGGRQFTHLANAQASLVLRSALFRLPIRASRSLIPSVIYTDPELARVGLSEAEARTRFGGVEVVRASFGDNDRARAERTGAGEIKVVASKRGKILGVTIVGPQAGELISLWSLAMARGLCLSAIAQLIMPYPTLSETGKRAAISFYAPRLASPWVRGVVRLLRRLG